MFHWPIRFVAIGHQKMCQKDDGEEMLPPSVYDPWDPNVALAK